MALNNKRDVYSQKEEMLAPYKVKCKCGHTLFPIKKAQICSYCGKLVKPKKQDFKDKLLNIMKGEK